MAQSQSATQNSISVGIKSVHSDDILQKEAKR